MRLKKITIFLGLFIIISASFMNRVGEWAYKNFGKGNVAVTLAVALLFCALCFLRQGIKRHFRLRRKIILLIFFALSFYSLAQIKILAERVHLFEYGLLGFLSTRDLQNTKQIKATLISLIFVSVVGIIDELFQGVLPNRYCTISDMVLNAASGSGGIILFWLMR